MKLKRLVVFLIIISLIALGGYFYITKISGQKLAKLQINSNTQVDVFVNGENIGNNFPIEKTYEAKKYVLKIGDYETNVYLQPGIETVVNRYFEDGGSYGEIFSFEESGQSFPSLTVISNPNNLDIFVDNKNIGFTPISIDNLSEGQHTLQIENENHVKKDFKIKVYKGYRLTANISLSSGNVKPETLEETTTKALVKILSTPNGFLRVRKEPTTTSQEIFRVHKDEEYELKSVDDKEGFFEIRIDASRSGWISQSYAKTL